MAVLQVALDLPVPRLFDYVCPDASPADVGYLVTVPFGRRQLLGLITGVAAQSELAPDKLKRAGTVLRDGPRLPSSWFELISFVSNYYQHAFGEVAFAGLPPGLKRVQKRRRRNSAAASSAPASSAPIALTSAQERALAELMQPAAGYCVHLLHGVTGSGKTELYLRLIEFHLTGGGQALVLVPEINLTPGLLAWFERRLPQRRVALLTSALGEAERERHWFAAFSGAADIVLGTRLAVLVPLPQLRLVVVDEEHDPSFKQQEGVRYSARDVAIYRAKQANVPVVLGSATPSLESYHHAVRGRYRLVQLATRARGQLPVIECVDLRRDKLNEGLSEQALAALRETLERGEQALVFLNRRGYAPVLFCPACAWNAGCPRCSCRLVYHAQAVGALCCHHCGFTTALPRACPDCGNQDLRPYGRGTQRAAAHLSAVFPGVPVLRIDRDSMRARGAWQATSRQIEGGAPTILVGTQMLAKGHDFARLALAVVLHADAALFAADFRATERLFATLLQVAGRTGRGNALGRVLVQTEFPQHPLYAALRANDYAAFARQELMARRRAGFPPFAYQALLAAEADSQEAALGFLRRAIELAAPPPAEVDLYDPVPMRLARKASRERAQLLVQSTRRSALRSFLAAWRQRLVGIRAAGVHWAMDVDPVDL
jgi:primosomal protein N' (replication factor Y)